VDLIVAALADLVLIDRVLWGNAVGLYRPQGPAAK
jgi:hypothetical protein